MTETPTLGLLDLDSKEKYRDEIRRGMITDLSVSLMMKLNPEMTQDDAHKLFFDRDPFHDPLEEIIEHADQIEDEFSTKGLKAAIKIARFYTENPTTFVPNRLIVYDPEQDPHKEIEEGERVLLFVNTNRFYQKDTTITLQKERPANGATITFETPDVFLEAFNGETVTLQGAENVMLGGTMIPTKGSITNKGILAIMPEAHMGEEAHRGLTINISLNSQGDIIQDPKSQVNTATITCNNYIRRGGEMVRPSVTKRGEKVEINCAGEFQRQEPDPKYFRITDKHSSEREVKNIRWEL